MPIRYLARTLHRTADEPAPWREARRPGIGALLWSAAVAAALVATPAGPAQAVFNGSSSDPENYGWVVKVDMTYPEGVVSCTGSLIKPDTVVTAAHCIRYNGREPSRTSVTFNSGHKREQYSIAVAHAVPMPEYNPALIKDDIALLFLESAVSEPTIELASADAPVGARVTAAGYGCTGDPFKAQDPCGAPNRLREIEVRTVAAGTCPDIAGPWQFCTYSKNRSANHGDSGGPVVWTDDGVQKLVGVTNAIELPPVPSYLNMSASVAYELDWIRSAAGMR
jgi:secreted trypsin-like serine protease